MVYITIGIRNIMIINLNKLREDMKIIINPKNIKIKNINLRYISLDK